MGMWELLGHGFLKKAFFVITGDHEEVVSHFCAGDWRLGCDLAVSRKEDCLRFLSARRVHT